MPTRHLPPALARLIRIITWVENFLLIALLALMVGLAGTQILFRNLLDTSILGVDQLLRLLVLWVALLGAVAASREGKHIRVDAIARWLPPRLHAGVNALTDVFTIGVCLTLAFQAGRFVQAEYVNGELAFGTLPAWVAQLILPAAFGLIALRYGLRLAHHLRQGLGREEIRPEEIK
jgi:TRAP-type C4-dicarboxylate transport system permease small subunit